MYEHVDQSLVQTIVQNGVYKEPVSFKNDAFIRHKYLVARELGGNDYISLNIYQLSSGAKLKPCEMPEKKVIDFVMGLVVEQDQAC